MSEVLVADDSPPLRLLVKRRLEMAGHHVVEAADRMQQSRHEAATGMGIGMGPGC